MSLEQKRRSGFTLVELLVVMGMIAIIMGAMTSAVTSARARARIQKATSDVKVITQAILAYENYAQGGKLEQTGGWKDADMSNLGFLLGKKGSALESGGTIPNLISAALNGKGQILDPWGHPYRFKITAGAISYNSDVLKSDIKSGFSQPNVYRISEGER